MSEKPVGKVQNAKAHQKELMAEQPVNRAQTKSNKAADARDTGSRGAGPVGNMEGQKGSTGQPKGKQTTTWPKGRPV